MERMVKAGHFKGTPCCSHSVGDYSLLSTNCDRRIKQTVTYVGGGEIIPAKECTRLEFWKAHQLMWHATFLLQPVKITRVKTVSSVPSQIRHAKKVKGRKQSKS